MAQRTFMPKPWRKWTIICNDAQKPTLSREKALIFFSAQKRLKCRFKKGHFRFWWKNEKKINRKPNKSKTVGFIRFQKFSEMTFSVFENRNNSNLKISFRNSERKPKTVFRIQTRWVIRIMTHFFNFFNILPCKIYKQILYQNIVPIQK